MKMVANSERATGAGEQPAGIPASRVAAILPALNEEAAIAAVLAGLRRAGLGWVIVVDNGSRDRTADRARDAGAMVIAEPRRGYGAACWQGMLALPAAAEWVLFCDADGSDDLDRIADFLSLASDFDFVLGARESARGGGVTLAQRIGNAIATRCMRWGWGWRYRDMGPFRLIRRSALERLRMQDRSWGWTLEMQVRAVEEGLRITEIVVRSLPREGGVSKIGGSWVGGAKAGVKIILTLVRMYARRQATRWFSAPVQ